MDKSQVYNFEFKNKSKLQNNVQYHVISLKLKNPQDNTPCRGVILAVAEAMEAPPIFPLHSLFVNPPPSWANTFCFTWRLKENVQPPRGRPECQGPYDRRELAGKHLNLLGPQMEQLWGSSYMGHKSLCGTEPQLLTRITYSSPTALASFSSQNHFPTSLQVRPRINSPINY